MNIPTAQEKRTQFNNLQTEAGRRLTAKVEKAIQEATSPLISIWLDAYASGEMIKIVIAELDELGYRARVEYGDAREPGTRLIVEF